MTDPLDTAAIRADVFATADRMFRQITAKYSDESRAALYAVASTTAIPLVVEIVELRERIAELEAEQQNGEWDTQFGILSPSGFLRLTMQADRASHQRRVWYGPVTPVSDTTGDQQ